MASFNPFKESQKIKVTFPDGSSKIHPSVLVACFAYNISASMVYKLLKSGDSHPTKGMRFEKLQ